MVRQDGVPAEDGRAAWKGHPRWFSRRERDMTHRHTPLCRPRRQSRTQWYWAQAACDSSSLAGYSRAIGRLALLPAMVRFVSVRTRLCSRMFRVVQSGTANRHTHDFARVRLMYSAMEQYPTMARAMRPPIWISDTALPSAHSVDSADTVDSTPRTSCRHPSVVAEKLTAPPMIAKMLGCRSGW